jgi:hypothetical protein
MRRLLLIPLLMLPAACDRGSSNKPAPASTEVSPAKVEQILAQVKRPDGAATPADGIAVTILVDTSGSMSESVPDAGGKRAEKMAIARRSIQKVVKQVVEFKKEQGDRPVMLGLYEFSASVPGKCRPVLELAPPDEPAAKHALDQMTPRGATPIGEAIIRAKQDLNRSNLSRKHILVVTDGANTDGHTPQDVMAAIAKLPDDDRPGVYFIAFDVNAAVFAKAKEHGAVVLPAANEAELQKALDELVGERILLEK